MLRIRMARTGAKKQCSYRIVVIEKEKAALEIFRVLKPGGRLHLADMVLVKPLPQERQSRIDNWYQ